MNIHANPTLEERAQMALNESLKTRAEYEMWANVLSCLKAHEGEDGGWLALEMSWSCKLDNHLLGVIYTGDGEEFKVIVYVDDFEEFGEIPNTTSIIVKSGYPIDTSEVYEAIAKRQKIIADFYSRICEARREFLAKLNSAK